jgi:hypothetical protein
LTYLNRRRWVWCRNIDDEFTCNYKRQYQSEKIQNAIYILNTVSN